MSPLSLVDRRDNRAQLRVNRRRRRGADQKKKRLHGEELTITTLPFWGTFSGICASLHLRLSRATRGESRSMRKSVILLSCCTALMSANAIAAPPAIPPILIGTPTAAQINQRCNMLVARSTALRTRSKSPRAPPTVGTTLTAYDKVIEVISDGQGEAGFYRQVSPSAASREAAEKCEVRMASEGTKLSLSRPTYERLKAMRRRPMATKLYLDRNLGAFERAGIALDDAGRAKAQKLGDEI